MYDGQIKKFGTKEIWEDLVIKMMLLNIASNVADPVFLPRSGSGFQIFLYLVPDQVSAQILERKKSAERSLKVIYQKKTYDSSV